ncbi:hypothetical protein NXH76_24820 [Blautia schinkii]|nr:hypothetical protein [Blautia schinkii]
MLRIVLGIVFIMVISGLGHLALNYGRRASKNSKRGYARLKIFCLIFGIVAFIFWGWFIYITLLSHINRENLGLLPCSSVFLIACVVMVWQWISERIWYDKTSFVVRNFWMVKRKYAYKDITGICKTTDVYLIVGETSIAVSALMEGGERFIHAAQKGYAEANKGEHIPRVFRRPRKAINGNLAVSHDFVFIGALLLTLLGGFLLSLNLHPSEMTSEHFEASIENVYESEEDLVFYLQNQEEPFVIKDFWEYAKNIHLLREPDVKDTTFSVYAEYKPASRSRDAYYHVCSMGDGNGNIYVTFDLTWHQEREWRSSSSIMIGIFLIIIIISGVACAISARNPEKHKLLYWLCFSKKGRD